MPQWPGDAEHILDAEELLKGWLQRCDDNAACISGIAGTRREFCIVYFSADHAFKGSEAEEAAAHVLTVYGLLGSCSLFRDREWDYYYWYDGAGLDDDRSILEQSLAMVPLYMSCSTQMLIYNDQSPEPISSWTRLERRLCYGFTFSPITVYTDSSYPDNVFDLEQIVAQNPETYCFDESGHKPLGYTKGKVLALKLLDPCENACIETAGSHHNLSSLDAIHRLSKLCVSVPPLNLSLASVLDQHALKHSGQESTTESVYASCYSSGLLLLDVEHAEGIYH